MNYILELFSNPERTTIKIDVKKNNLERFSPKEKQFPVDQFYGKKKLF